MRISNPGQYLLSLWRRLGRNALGRWAFELILFKMVPYSGSIRANVLTLEPGHARIQLRDRRAVRNHLSSVHAMALANLCELTSGLAMLTALPTNARGILSGFHVHYLKKARGILIAESRVEKIESNASQQLMVTVEARDSAGDCVTKAEAYWKIGPSV